MMQSPLVAGASTAYGAPDRPLYGTDPRSRDRPENPDALFASTSSQGQRPPARQLPPGAGYAADLEPRRVDLTPSASTRFGPTAEPTTYNSPAAPPLASRLDRPPLGDVGTQSRTVRSSSAPVDATGAGVSAGTGSSGGRRAADPSSAYVGSSAGVTRGGAETPPRAATKLGDDQAPWSIALQEPTPPPSQHFSGASTDLRPDPGSRRQSSGSPGENVNYSRPNSAFAFAALATKTPTSVTGEVSSSSDAPTVRSPEHPELLQRDSFVGIPGGRTLGSTREAALSTERQSRIPAFEPAVSFSPQDRGPYPPHSMSPTRAHQVQQSDAEVLAERKLSYSPVMSGAPELPPTDAGRPGSLAFDASAFPSDLAGIGRNSVIRAAASPPLFSATSSPLDQLGSGLVSPGGGQGPARTQAPLVQMSPQAVSVSQQAQASPGPPYAFPNSNVALPSPPPHLVPQPEICVECMMRDRDMADVDVTTAGVWERASDADYEEQMRWEAEAAHEGVGPSTGSATPATSSWSGEHTGSVESAAAASKRRESGAAQSRESLGGRSSLAHGNAPPKGRKRLGRGQLLTSGNLKVWTTMNPPAAAHRWRTLQTYLVTQAHYLELDRQGREAEQSQSLPARPTQHVARPSQGSRSWSSSVLSPAGLAAEKAALEQEAQSRRAGKARNLSRGTLVDETNRLSSASLLPPPIGTAGPSARRANVVSSGASMRSYSSGDQPWLGNQLRRISTSGGGRDGPQADSPQGQRFTFSPFTRSATDLRVLPSPRSVSPARTSDDRRTSMWSRFRQSGTASVLSFAPSGSMLDMHLGLSQDKHMPYASNAPYETYPSRSDPAVARHAEDSRRAQGLAASQATGESSGAKKKKKGIKGFFNKLVGGSNANKKVVPTSVSAPPTPGADGPYDESLDDSELAPPPPLSALVNEPHYHQRSVSSSSVDSFGPVTPPVPGGGNFRFGGSQGFETGSLRMPADRQSMASFNSARSRPLVANGPESLRNGGAWPSADSLRDPAYIDPGEHEILAGADDHHPPPHLPPVPRPHKSLPLLPSEDPYASRPPLEAYQDPNLPLAPPNAPYAHYGASRSSQSFDPSLSQSNFVEDFGYDARPILVGGRDRSATVTGDGRSIHKARSRSKIFSMSFGKKGKHAENIPPPLPHPNLRANSLDSGVALGAGAGSPYRSGYV
ncbi:hypothetical protein BMF94_0638 [Rhodotorula taiwanensis]|uniref:Proteophosphoglycan ppg4 n=1 Tax=Rhodotorula taiwanensis TaxID=741276 RepID=A0A2S5BI34_9BASI|nr:hypothetical protein BMF94_0638 [Rhodotorula taiwanensis]